MVTMRYIAQRSKGAYLVRDLADWSVVARTRTYEQARAEAQRLSAAYIQKLKTAA